MSSCRCGITHLAYSKQAQAYVNRQGETHDCLLEKKIKSLQKELDFYKSKREKIRVFG